ncbi:MAG: dihydroxyacetone kinase subunit DhaL [Spirochaetaceae bacterium]
MAFDAQTARAVVHRLREIMEENKEYLIELDGVMGDGDLGLTMRKCFVTADDQLSSSEETDVGKFFMKAGMTIAGAAPSTMGTLVGTGFMRGGKAVAGKESLGSSDLAAFFAAFVQGLMERGKAKPGEKTIIDSLNPVAEAIEGAGDDPATALEAGLEAAQQGLEATKEMVAQHGRAAYYQEQSKGRQDPGATVGVMIVRGFKEGVTG